MSANLQLPLLFKIMRCLGELADKYPKLMTTSDLVALIPERVEQDGEQLARNFINRHLVHLAGRGYVTLGASTTEGFRVVRLTAQGEMFVQPELAEFGGEPMLPQVVKSLEDEIQVLTYPQEEKDGMLYSLREAIAMKAPDVIAKVITEVGFAILKSQM
jgi:hypothetical protein